MKVWISVSAGMTLRWLWTCVQYIGGIYLAGVLVEVQAARKLVVMHTFIVAA